MGEQLHVPGDVVTEVMYLPGVAGHYASTPDSAAVSVTGDIDIRCKVALTDWTPTTIQTLVSKYYATGNQRCHAFSIDTAGKPTLLLSADGTAYTTTTSSVATGVTDGATKWVRATWRASDGRIQFFLSDDGSAWAQLGTDKTYAIASIYDSNDLLEVGAYGRGTGAPATGKFHRAQVLNGIDGTVVFDANFTDRGNTFTEDSSNHATVTIWGRLQGYEPTWLPAEALYGVANHYGYEMKKLDAPEPTPKTTYPAATGGTTYPAQR